MLVETSEQVLDRLRLCQMLPEQPDRLGIRYPITEPKSEETHEGQPVLDLELRLVV